MKGEKRVWQRTGKLYLYPSLPWGDPVEPTVIILHNLRKLEKGLGRRRVFPDKSRIELGLDYSEVTILMTEVGTGRSVRFTGNYLGVFEDGTKLALYQLPSRCWEGPKSVQFVEAEKLNTRKVKIEVTFRR